MPDNEYFTLEVQHCPNYVMVGGEQVVELAPRGDDPTGQKWSLQPILDPDRGLIGWILTNASSGGALRFAGAGKLVEVGSGRAPVEPDVVWDLTVYENGPYVLVRPALDDGQALDAKLTNNQCQGGQIQCHGSNKGDHQQWRLYPVPRSTEGGSHE